MKGSEDSLYHRIRRTHALLNAVVQMVGATKGLTDKTLDEVTADALATMRKVSDETDRRLLDAIDPS